MTTTMHEPSIGSARESIADRLLVPAFWGAVSIIAMWLAVLFDGIYGSDMVFNGPPGGSGPTIIPSAVAVALFAFIGTVAVAKRAFARQGPD